MLGKILVAAVVATKPGRELLIVSIKTARSIGATVLKNGHTPTHGCVKYEGAIAQRLTKWYGCPCPNNRKDYNR